MFPKSMSTIGLTCVLMLLARHPLFAAENGQVTARGDAERSSPPTTVRLQIEVLAQGDDLESALQSLADATKSATDQATEWGAPAASVRIASPAVATGRFATPQLAPLQPLAVDFDQAPGGFDQPPGGQGPGNFDQGPTVASPASPPDVPDSSIRPIVAVVLSADFPLSAGASAADGLLAVERLRKQIADTDLSGMRKLDSGVACSTCGPQPGAPSFLFVRQVSADEQAAALADAFAQSRRIAQQLATAAGQKLGVVRQLAVAEQPVIGSPFEALPPGGASPGPARPGRDGNVEAVSPTAGDLAYRIAVEASFELNGPKNPEAKSASSR